VLYTFSKLRPFPYTDKLFFNFFIFAPSKSLATSCLNYPAACTANPPTPENG